MYPEKVNHYPGKLIAFEGIDRAGKSSAVGMLPALLEGCNVPIISLGEKRSPFKALLTGEALKTASPFLKTYLFATDRAWTYEMECLPALKRGELVLWDRYVDSAIVYRSVELRCYCSIIDLDFVKDINSPFIQPNLTFYLKINKETFLSRQQPGSMNEPYNYDFLEQVEKEYDALADLPKYIVVNAKHSPEEVAGEIADIIRREIKELFI